LDESDAVVSAIDRDDVNYIRNWLQSSHSPAEKIKNRIQETALERAAIRGSEKVFDALMTELELSTDVDPKVWRDSRGTPLIVGMAALSNPDKKVSKKYERMIERFLVDHSDHVNDRDRAYIGDGRTALHEAAVVGNVRLMEVLISHGAQVDSENSIGETPLHFAARFGKLGALKLLISHGAAIDPKSKHTKATPLLIAAESGHEAIIRELLDSGAKKNTRDIFGKTAPDRYREYVKSFHSQKPSN
jgi:ankyrin repeat protein